VLDVLKEENLLSEIRYALQFIESRQRKNPEGRALMAQRLAAKGVERESAERALDELYTEEQIIDYVERAYVLAVKKVGEEKARMVLAKKGFSSYEVRLGLESLI
jgi:regulatory protein